MRKTKVAIRRKSTILLFICWVICILIMSSFVSGKTTYSVVDLGQLPGGNTSTAHAINNQGQITGWAITASGIRHAFYWDPITRKMVDLEGLPGYKGYSDGWGINNNGQVIGNCRTSLGGTIRGFIWDPVNGMQDLGSVFPRAINNNGTIVGDNGTAMRKLAGGSWESLGLTAYSLSEGINDNEMIVGTVDSPYRVVYRWDAVNGVDILEEDLPGGKYVSDAIGIDNSGRILCNGYKTGDIYHAYIWDKGIVTDLGDLPGGNDYSQALGMNDLGQVVGDSSGSAFIWQNNTGMLKLDDMLDGTGIGWHLIEAFSINEYGMIVGEGTNPAGLTHAFLLTPIPEPASAVLMGLGYLFAGVRKRQR